MGVRTVTTVRIHCPVAPETFAALVAGRGAALEADPAAAAVLAAIRGAGLGDFGSYTGVVEVALGLEVFTPTAAARPVQGRAGETSHVPMVIMTTWADADSAALDAAIAAIAAAHPWEVPVIELSQARMLQA
jgi:hypothetical protein